MTLTIAGHNFELDEVLFDERPDYNHNGIFVISDSSVSNSNGRYARSTNFKKVREIKICVKSPIFHPSGRFQEYDHGKVVGCILLGFAGSTLSAREIFDKIEDGVGSFLVTCSRSSRDSPLQYHVCSSEDPNYLTDSVVPRYFGEDTFTPADIDCIDVSERTLRCIEDSIASTFESMRAMATSLDQFAAWQAEFVAGIFLPRSKEARLFQFLRERTINAEGLADFRTKTSEIKPGELSVLGLRREYGEQAKSHFELTMKNKLRTENEMIRFLEARIGERKSSGLCDLSMPISQLRHNYC